MPKSQLILGALLFALTLTMAVRVADEEIDRAVTPRRDTPAQEQAEAAAAAGTKAAAPAPSPAAAPAQSAAAPSGGDIAQRLKEASAARGEQAAHKCGACHTFGEGQPAHVGPNLRGVVGRKVATFPGFAYSDALKTLGGIWTDARIDTFITKPQAYAPGTKMGFPGDPDPKDRADIIAYLNSISPGAPPP